MDILVLGVYHVPISQELFEKCVEYLYGSEMSEERRRFAETDCREQLESVKLIEIEVCNGEEDLSFGDFTQETPGKSPSDWQVAYDEQKIETTNTGSRWVFFFHYLDLSQPLKTPAGTLALPQPQDLPSRLSHIDYFPP